MPSINTHTGFDALFFPPQRRYPYQMASAIGGRGCGCRRITTFRCDDSLSDAPLCQCMAGCRDASFVDRRRAEGGFECSERAWTTLGKDSEGVAKAGDQRRYLRDFTLPSPMSAVVITRSGNPCPVSTRSSVETSTKHYL